MIPSPRREGYFDGRVGWRRAAGASFPGRRIATTICHRFNTFDHFPVATTCMSFPSLAYSGKG